MKGAIRTVISCVFIGSALFGGGKRILAKYASVDSAVPRQAEAPRTPPTPPTPPSPADNHSVDSPTPSEIYERASRSTVLVINLGNMGETRATGSGVVITDRNIVTNCHVIEGAAAINVRNGGNDHVASLRYSDGERDVCALNVPTLTAPPVRIGSTENLKVGAKVYAIGAPRGFELTLSDGLVSSLRPVGGGGHYIQTTAAISPGSSGGGLFDETGALVGLTTFFYKDSQSLNFAVPIEWIKELPTHSANASRQRVQISWLDTAIFLENQRQWPELVQHCQRWANAEPNNYLAWFSLGTAYTDNGQPMEAIEAFRRALVIDSHNASAWSSLAHAYDVSGQRAMAIEASRQAALIDPSLAESVPALTGP